MSTTLIRALLVFCSKKTRRVASAELARTRFLSRIKSLIRVGCQQLPPTRKKLAKLDLGATAPPHDGNHSTCGYLGVIWTPWRDSNSQIGLIPLSLCWERRSKKVTHFRLYGNVRTWHGQIQELKGGFNRGYGGHWAADGKPNSPPSLPYTTATMRVHPGRDSAPEPKITIIPSFLLREWKLLLFFVFTITFLDRIVFF